jgi:hypothetical protein
VLNKRKATKPERPFMNLSVDEMAAQINTNTQALDRRNCLILALFFGCALLASVVGFWFYGEWLMETVSAFWQVGVYLWQWEWWLAAQLLFHYKISFFLLGIIVGFALFLFVIFQIGELLVDLLWDAISSLFN